jgi:uncharacterized glyoxalase superfamily protein PhnB
MSDKPYLGGASIVADDMEAAIAFYERIGFTVDFHPDWRAHHVTLKSDQGLEVDIDSVAMTKTYDSAWTSDKGGAVLIVRVPTREAVDATFALATAAGAPARQEPFDAFWGARYALVDDPAGNPVGIMSPSDPAMNSAPPKL